MKLIFVYLAQPHQVPHSLPLAAEIAIADASVQVRIACSTDEQEVLAKTLAARYPQAHLEFRRLRVPLPARWLGRGFGSVPTKEWVLLANRGELREYDAIVVPERTSLLLKKIGVTRPQLVWTSHGAGDRAISYAPDLAEFDFAFLAGVKQEQRMLAEGLVRPGHYHVGSYPKFDLMRSAGGPERFFDNARPTVLYNPHFRPALSSWPRLGYEVLDWFADQDRYNLIFAPHVRLFDRSGGKLPARLQNYARHAHLRIDTGSPRCIDMSYLRAADVYLGDVSSQVTEFLMQPRPCVFLNAHEVQWRDDPDYLFWKTGPVITRISDLASALEQARAPHWQALQREYFAQSFSVPPDRPSAPGAAAALLRYLQDCAQRGHVGAVVEHAADGIGERGGIAGRSQRSERTFEQ